MRGQNVAAAAVLARALACGGLLMLLASCQSTTVEQRDVQEPPTSGETNDPAAGFQNMQAGSEEDFILNVGRRTFFPQAPRSSTRSPRRRSTARSPG